MTFFLAPPPRVALTGSWCAPAIRTNEERHASPRMSGPGRQGQKQTECSARNIANRCPMLPADAACCHSARAARDLLDANGEEGASSASETGLPHHEETHTGHDGTH